MIFIYSLVWQAICRFHGTVNRLSDFDLSRSSSVYGKYRFEPSPEIVSDYGRLAGYLRSHRVNLTVFLTNTIACFFLFLCGNMHIDNIRQYGKYLSHFTGNHKNEQFEFYNSIIYTQLSCIKSNYGL